jgi:hypothetical protein
MNTCFRNHLTYLPLVLLRIFVLNLLQYVEYDVSSYGEGGGGGEGLSIWSNGFMLSTGPIINETY